MPHVPFEDLPELLTPEEAREYLRVSKNTIYDLLRRGEIPSVRYGRLIRVPKSAIAARRGDQL
jgi:putative molybdopterin biosynthesis protein